jgi:hypothetical protein
MTALRSYFAACAEREVRVRETHYPAMIEAGTIARDDAEADLGAWRDIYCLFFAGTVDTARSWAQLELATSRALQRCEADLAAQPDNARRRERRDAVWGIHERITWYRWFWTQLGAPAPVALIAEAA